MSPLLALAVFPYPSPRPPRAHMLPLVVPRTASANTPMPLARLSSWHPVRVTWRLCAKYGPHHSKKVLGCRQSCDGGDVGIVLLARPTSKVLQPLGGCMTLHVCLLRHTQVDMGCWSNKPKKRLVPCNLSKRTIVCCFEKLAVYATRHAPSRHACVHCLYIFCWNTIKRSKTILIPHTFAFLFFLVALAAMSCNAPLGATPC